MFKNNFREYAIADSVTHNLSRKPEWWWKFHPPTTGDEIRLTKYLETDRFDENGVAQPVTSIEIALREIALTFDGTNIPVDVEKPVEEGGEPILMPGSTVEMIEFVLSEMPNDLVIELWSAMKKAAPYWGPAVKKAADEKKTPSRA